MNLVKMVAGAVLSAALFSGCVTDNYVVRSTPDYSWKQSYHGNPPKFMQPPYGFKTPAYTQMKFKR